MPEEDKPKDTGGKTSNSAGVQASDRELNEDMISPTWRKFTTLLSGQNNGNSLKALVNSLKSAIPWLIFGTISGLVLAVTTNVIENVIWPIIFGSVSTPETVSLLASTQETSSVAQMLIPYLEMGTGAIILGPVIGLTGWLSSRAIWKEKITSKRITTEFSIPKNKTGKIKSTVIGDGVDITDISRIMNLYHEGDVFLDPFEGVSKTGFEWNEIGSAWNGIELFTVEIEMQVSKPLDSLQKGVRPEEIIPGDSDRGLPLDSLLQILDEIPHPSVIQTTIGAVENAQSLRDTKIERIRNNKDTHPFMRLKRWFDGPNPEIKLSEAAKTRIENLEGASGGAVAVNIRIITLVPSSITSNQKQSVLGQLKKIDTGVSDLMPPYVGLNAKVGSTLSSNPLKRLRAMGTLRRFQDRELSVTRPSWLKSLIGGQNRKNIILDAASGILFLALPGAGSEKIQRRLKIVSRDQTPTGEPPVEILDVLQSEDYDPQNVANSFESSDEAKASSTEKTDSTTETQDAQTDNSENDDLPLEGLNKLLYLVSKFLS